MVTVQGARAVAYTGYRWHCRTAIANWPHLGSPRFWSYSEHPVIPVTWTKLKRSVEPFLLSLQNKVWICWNVTLNTWKAVSNKMTVEICWDYISLLDHSCTQRLSDLGEKRRIIQQCSAILWGIIASKNKRAKTKFWSLSLKVSLSVGLGGEGTGKRLL